MAKEKQSAATDAAISGILTKEEIDKAKNLAREKVMRDKKKMAEEAVFAEAERELSIQEGLLEVDPAEEMQTVTVDLAEYGAFVAMDNKRYMHGATYTVSKKVADVIREANWRSWRHEAKRHGEVGTRAADIFKPRNTVIGPKTLANAPRPFA